MAEIIHHMGRKKLMIFNKPSKRFNQITIGPKRNYRMRTRMKRSIDIKSQNMWYTAGDLNTKLYHALTKQQRVHNRILELCDEKGNWITKDQGVEKVAVDYFEDLFSTTSPLEFESFLEEITPSITIRMNQMMLRVATEDEVRHALFMMHPEKAPNPEGMTALFFQHSWHIIKNALVEMVNIFFDPRRYGFNVKY